MNSFKSILWLLAAGAALYFGLRLQKERGLDELQQDYNNVTARAMELSRDMAALKEKLQNARMEGGTGESFEAAHNASLANLAAEQKKIENLLAQWPVVEADRVAAVQTVREKTFLLPPATITLADGSKLEKFVVKSVPNEQTVGVEHAHGLVKLSLDKTPDDLKERLALGWKPDLPATLSMDKDGNAIVRQAQRSAAGKEAEAEAAKDLNLMEKDSTTIGGLTRSLAATETMLAQAEKNFDSERLYIRTLGIFKSDIKDPKTGKTYGQVKKEANARLSGLAVQVSALRAQRSEVQHKMKTL